MRFLLNLGILTVVTLVALLAGEAMFRLVPSLIGIAVIDRMHPELRSQIAAQLKLPTNDDYIILPSAKRTDHGPDLFLTKPNWSYFRPADDIDKLVGAVDTTTTDFRGFCNSQSIASDKTFDVVTVGGSIPNCDLVVGENVFANQLGNILSVPSYNLTVHGVGPYEYNEVIKRYYADLQPRIVIYAISEANDLRDCIRYLEFVSGKRGDRNSRLGGLFRVSYALAFIKGSIEVLYKRLSTAVGPNFRYSVKVLGTTVNMNAANGDLDELKSALKLQEGEIQPDLYTEPLTEFVKFARQSQFVPLVVYVPTAYTVYQNTIEFQDESLENLMREYSKVQQDWLAKNSKQIGYAFVDPTVDMQQRASTGPLLYFPSDLHPTPAGHKALAETIAPTVFKLLSDR
ncbi:MAG: hypothetical protein ABI705_00425 [Aestuariivirga sp.]